MVEVRPGAATLADELRGLHRALDELVEALPETRTSVRTDRDGWTIKHELAYLAASCELVIRLAHVLPAASHDAPAILAADEADLRRSRGEAMHVAKELRLTPLREHLASLVSAAAEAIERHTPLLDRPVALAGDPAPAVDHLRAHLARMSEGIERLRGVMG